MRSRRSRMAEITRELARYAVEARWEALPDPVGQQGRRAFVNWIGNVLGGCRDGSIDRVLAAFGDHAGPPRATMLGRGARTDIFLAALVNCLGSALHSYNDTHLATVAHPTGPVAAAALALAETRPVSGAEFLNAL